VEAKIHSGERAAQKEDAKLSPTAMLALLEADQVVAAKQQTRFGPRRFSWGMRAILWGLRVYVVVMLVIVLISVVRATHGTP
jgi:hypothetical protein